MVSLVKVLFVLCCCLLRLLVTAERCNFCRNHYKWVSSIPLKVNRIHHQIAISIEGRDGEKKERSGRKKSETASGDNLGPLRRLLLPVTCCEWLAAILLSTLSLTDTKNQLFVVSIRARQTFWRRVASSVVLRNLAKHPLNTVLQRYYHVPRNWIGCRCRLDLTERTNEPRAFLRWHLWHVNILFTYFTPQVITTLDIKRAICKL